MLPDAEKLKTARNDAKLPAQSFEIQKIEEANGPHVNFDSFAVEIRRLPTGTTAPKLFEEFRQNLNDYFDHAFASIGGKEAADRTAWSAAGNAPIGSIMVFKIPVLKILNEQAAVITSLSENTRWVFTPIKMGFTCPGCEKSAVRAGIPMP